MSNRKGHDRFLVTAQAAQYPAGHCTVIGAAAMQLEPPPQIIVRGPAADLHRWLTVARRTGRAGASAYGIPYDNVRTLPDYLPKLVGADDQQRVIAYVCANFSCSLPIRSLDEFEQTLRG